MSNSGLYTALQDGEIRLLSLEPSKRDSSCPIRCSLETVQLPGSNQDGSISQFIGDDRMWPELNDTGMSSYEDLFRNRMEAKIQIKSLPPTASCKQAGVAEAKRTEGPYPWRNCWGDYFALSYCWGPTEPKCSITINEKIVLVGPNLHEALLHLRCSYRVRQGFKLWIDAICINQADKAERGKQVQLMGQVYASAWQVVTWLGSASAGSSSAMRTLRWLAARSKAEQPLGFYKRNPQVDCTPLFVKWETYSTPLRKEVYEAVFRILSRPYWRRMWILQEVAMARQDAPVMCGYDCVSWRDIFSAVELIDSDEQRFGRDIIGSIRPRVWRYWTFEIARDRLVSERALSSERMWRLVVEMMHLQQSQIAGRSAIDSQKLLQVLYLVQEAQATEDRDKVYGALGLMAVASSVKMVADYERELSDIYQDFSRQLLMSDVNVLRLVSQPAGYVYEKRRLDWSVDYIPRMLRSSSMMRTIGPILYSLQFSRKAFKQFVGTTCAHDLPSWTVCWLCEAAPVKPLRGLYKAGGTQTQRVVPAAVSGRSLSVEGLIFDEITSLSSFHVFETDKTFPVNTASLRPSNAYGDVEGVRRALWKTLVGDSTNEGNMKAPEECRWLLEPKLWNIGVAGYYMNGFDLRRFMSRNRDLGLCGYTLSDLIFTPQSLDAQPLRSYGRQCYDPGQVEREALSWALNILAWRRLVGTKQGRMGLVPAAAGPGDCLAIILGCDTPLVLRKQGNNWTVVGECYVHGVMYGELLGERTSFEEIRIV